MNHWKENLITPNNQINYSKHFFSNLGHTFEQIWAAADWEGAALKPWLCERVNFEAVTFYIYILGHWHPITTLMFSIFRESMSGRGNKATAKILETPTPISENCDQTLKNKIIKMIWIFRFIILSVNFIAWSLIQGLLHTARDITLLGKY